MEMAYSSYHVVWAIKQLKDAQMFGKFELPLANDPQWTACLNKWLTGKDDEMVFFVRGGGNVTFARLRFDEPLSAGICYRLIIKNRITGVVQEFPHFATIGVPSQHISIPKEKIPDGDYMIHIWLDYLPNIFEPYENMFGNSNNNPLLDHYRSVLPDVLAGAPSKYSDLLIKIGDNEKSFHVHRTVLAAHSSVFDTMLSSGQWKEQSDGVITMEDSSESAVTALLQYMYTGTLPENLETRRCEQLFEIVDLGEKYNIVGIKERLEFFFITKNRQWTDQDRVKQLKLADRYGLRNLKLVCELLLSTNLNVFSEMNQVVPLTIAQMNSEKLSLDVTAVQNCRG